MQLRQKDLDYFQRGEAENPRFWSRFDGGMPAMAGQTVADIGCGHGSLCVHMARAGAGRVVGYDINAKLIDFARANLEQNYPNLQPVIEFSMDGLHTSPDNTFDLVVSKDSFEHVINLDQVLAEIKRCLKPGGRLYAGFGPLWNSPYGDHGRTQSRIWWGHVFLREADIVEWFNRHHSRTIQSIHDLDLNAMSLADYRRVIDASGLRIVSFRINASNSWLSRLFSLIRQLPPLEEYFSHNIYCVLEKEPASGNHKTQHNQNGKHQSR